MRSFSWLKKNLQTKCVCEEENFTAFDPFVRAILRDVSFVDFNTNKNGLR